MRAKIKQLKKDGFMMPVSYELGEMLINTFDVETWRANNRKSIPKLKISL